MTVEEATKVSNGVAEGVPTTDAVVALGDQLDVPTPLAYQMSRVLNEGISCSEMLAGLFGHEVTGESREKRRIRGVYVVRAKSRGVYVVDVHE